MIVKAREHWAYPRMEEIFRKKQGDWVEVDEKFFYQAMEVLPPIMVDGLRAFMVSEPHAHEGGDAVYAMFVLAANKYYAKLVAFKQRHSELEKLRKRLGA